MFPSSQEMIPKRRRSIGYSLYHTHIEPIKQNDEYKETIELSSKILNLPVHQDVDPNLYPELVRLLVDSCRKHLI